MRLVNKLREARQARGVTLRTVAEAVSLDYSLLARMERGERRVPDEVKVALARYYNLPITDLFFAEDVVSETTTPATA